MDNGSDRPGGTGQKGDAARQERLAQALRANLKRRKAQLRGRADAAPADAPSGDHHPDGRG